MVCYFCCTFSFSSTKFYKLGEVILVKKDPFEFTISLTLHIYQIYLTSRVHISEHHWLYNHPFLSNTRSFQAGSTDAQIQRYVFLCNIFIFLLYLFLRSISSTVSCVDMCFNEYIKNFFLCNIIYNRSVTFYDRIN